MPAAPPALLRFLELYAAGEYWASHEALEDAWRATGSEFYKGLILVASACVHASRGNAHGVRAQATKAGAALRAYAPSYLGVDLVPILAWGDGAARALSHDGADAAAVRALPPPPPLAFDPRLARGDEPELSGTGPRR